MNPHTHQAEVKPEVAENQSALAETLNKLFEDIEALENLSVENAVQAKARAILFGHTLNNAKRNKNLIPSGDWSTWISRNCKFDIRTAQRYMSLATHESLLTSCKSIRECYLLLESNNKQKRVNGNVRATTPEGNTIPKNEINYDPFHEAKLAEQELREVFEGNKEHHDYPEMIKLLIPLVEIYNAYHESQERVVVE